jgi:beta-glucosidase
MWRRWNNDTHAWDRLSGGGHLLIARGLGDIRASIQLP